MSMDEKEFSTTVNMAVAMLLAPDKEEKKNPWFEQFENADEEEKLRIIWKVAHLATMNSVSKDALRTMFCWLVEYALEECVEEKKRMTGNEYQALAARTINKNLTAYEQIFHAMHGMAGEVGELHSLYQKIYQGHILDHDHEKKELGDLLWFIAEYCTARGWALEDVMQLNIDKLKARFPEGFDPDKSLHRKEGDV